MNERDQHNLKFLLGASNQELLAWYNSVSPADHAYAQELLNMYADELRQQRTEFEIETKLITSDYKEAKSVISKIMKVNS